jgi:flap endonuclease-1
MGVKINELAKKGKSKVFLKTLKNRIVAIDSYNLIFQFLSAIRYRDGKPLTDKEGNIVSHLSGIFYRTINYLTRDIKPIYIFDGNYPELKFDTLNERKKVRREAKKKAKKARNQGNIEEAIKYSKMTSTINSTIIEECKELINKFGIPFIQAKGEGEAQAAYMVKNNDAWGVVSKDYDTLLFGGTRFLNKFAPTKKTKLQKKIEFISLSKMLNNLGITQEQLVEMAILIGTDYYPGVKWIGQHTALKLIRKYKDLEGIMDAGKKIRGKKIKVKREILEKIREIYLNPSLKKDYYPLIWKEVDFEGLMEYMIETYDFSEKRIKNNLQRLKQNQKI